MSTLGGVAAVLFDLDGTLVDSAPDLTGAANEMLLARGLPALPFETLRPMCGSGARGMVGSAFGLRPGEDGYEALKNEFLDRYELRLLRETRVFAAVEPLLAALRAAELRWGVVTNKAERFALPLSQALELRPGALVGGDSTPHTKPHPAPLLEAARRLGVAPEHCVYVGDDERDVIAGQAAGMRTVAVRWGYLGQARAIEDWGASRVVDTPDELLRQLGLD
ncbi:phosphoglycolate phosphatase [Roseateles violae]|uniref:phosphoglycolate phosphatase n=1 Tax=Roseateles violae TaxID=3058042 RepID=A0ABT8DT63_9BURK|nr:phosphoglycolate phosphatase [Pelomonas sp. PFR6]MDN3920205.1 phosphoglycolate phosphatase [Pelomonas sp. PFR6]